MMKYITGILMVVTFLWMGCFPSHKSSGPPPGQTKAKQKGPPPWAPAHGYRAKTRYIFFPTVGIYYDLHQHEYIFRQGENWRYGAKLPPRYQKYELKKSKQVELKYSGKTPYYHYEKHVKKHKKHHKPGKPGKGKPGHPGKRGKGNPHK